ncbi:NINE protein [Ligilactobacillus pobuzihii]|uniref:TM2 domain-containing protein n=1 Tax=Ligilactobacillus pobuzihii TaxID=449659 RepID=UPI0019D091F0|nr:TM2 domain-containing protein [Ligilactobacillus pobuzihii]MBN7274903.1 NINE protein [Ligilactobacillus pobuzihii]
MENNTYLLSKLTNEEHLLVNSEVEKRKKSPVVAYLLWFFTGFMGGHRYFFHKTGSAVAMTLIFWLLVWLFGLGAIITGIWQLVDVFLINGWLKEDQNKVENEAIQEILSARSVEKKTDVPEQSPKDSENSENSENSKQVENEKD